MNKNSINLLFLVAILLSVKVQAQTRLASQDQGTIIEHSSCRIRLHISKNDRIISYNRDITDATKEIVNSKGYRYLSQPYYLGAENYKFLESRSGDLVFDVSVNEQQARVYEIKNGTQITILGEEYFEYDESFKKDIDSIVKLVKQIPSCVTVGSGLKIDNNYDYGIREYEVAMCSALFFQGYTNKGRKAGSKALGKVANFIPYIGALATAPIGPFVALGGFLAGAGFVHGVNALFESSDSVFNDGLILMKKVFECDQYLAGESPSGKNLCEYQKNFMNNLLFHPNRENGISKKGSKRVTRFIDRLGVKEFSVRFSDYIVVNKACSNPDKTVKNYKKILRRARRNF